MDKTTWFPEVEGAIDRLLQDGSNTVLLTSKLTKTCVFVHNQLNDGQTGWTFTNGEKRVNKTGFDTGCLSAILVKICRVQSNEPCGPMSCYTVLENVAKCYFPTFSVVYSACLSHVSFIGILRCLS